MPRLQFVEVVSDARALLVVDLAPLQAAREELEVERGFVFEVVRRFRGLEHRGQPGEDSVHLCVFERLATGVEPILVGVARQG